MHTAIRGGFILAMKGGVVWMRKGSLCSGTLLESEVAGMSAIRAAFALTSVGGGGSEYNEGAHSEGNV